MMIVRVPQSSSNSMSKMKNEQRFKSFPSSPDRLWMQKVDSTVAFDYSSRVVRIKLDTLEKKNRIGKKEAKSLSE